MRARAGGKPSGRIAHAAARVRLPKIAWELSVLFVLLMVVFAPNIVRWMAVIAPLIPAPQPAFVTPLQTWSANYNLTLMAGHAFAMMGSVNYNLTGWVVYGSAGVVNSTSYIVYLGVAPLLGVPAAELNWTDNYTIPASPASWLEGKTYNFNISWTAAPGRSLAEVKFRLYNVSCAGTLLNTTSFPNPVSKQMFTATMYNLSTGTYCYKWSARDSEGISGSTPDAYYTIAPGMSFAGNTTSPSSPTNYSSGKSYTFNITWSGAVSDIVLEWNGLNYSGRAGNLTSFTTSAASKAFTNLPAGSYQYHWWANNTEGEWNQTPEWTYNVTKAPITTRLQLCEPDSTGCVEGYKNYMTAGVKLFKANISVPGKLVGINVSDATGAVIAKAEPKANATNTTPDLDSGIYTIVAYFLGDDNYSASSVSYVTSVNFTDTSAPNWTGRGQTSDTVAQGSKNYLWAEWSDDGVLTNATLVTNETGTWQNQTGIYDSPFTFTTKPQFANFTWQNGTIGPRTVGWRIRVCDLSGKCNETDTRTFNICVRANPYVVVTPAEQSGTAGSALTYIINVTNADSPTCGASGFAINTLLPVGWGAPGGGGAAPVNPGTIASWTISITSPASATPGTYLITFNASNFDLPTYWSSVSATYNVVADNPPNLTGFGESKPATTKTRSIGLSAGCTDDFGLTQAILETNETGTWENKTAYDSPMTLSGTSALANFTWQNASVSLNTSVGWRIKCVDSKGQADTNVWTQSFSVIEPITSHTGVLLDANADCVLTDAELEPTIVAYWANPSDPVAIQRIEFATALWWFASYC